MQSQRLIQHTGSAELTIEGKNLKDTLRLLHDGVEYTPLASTDGSVTFILGDNGTNRIYVNGEYSFGVQISGIEVPTEINARVNAYQTSKSLIAGGENANNTTEFSKCINYPYVANETYPYFRFHFYGTFTEEELAKLTLYNCTSNAQQIDTNADILINVSVTDATKPAYITYKGFIIAVFNYTT